MLTIKYFTAIWCGPCKAFGPIFDGVMNETGVNFNRIDVDNNNFSENPEDLGSIINKIDAEINGLF